MNLRNLSLQGNNAVDVGIGVDSAMAVHLKNITLLNWTAQGFSATSSTPLLATLHNVAVRGASSIAAAYFQGAPSALVTAVVIGSTFSRSIYG